MVLVARGRIMYIPDAAATVSAGPKCTCIVENVIVILTETQSIPIFIPTHSNRIQAGRDSIHNKAKFS